MATLDPSEIMFTPFEPKTKNRFIMYIEGIPAYLIKTANRPQIQFEEIVLDHINVKRYIKGKGAWQPIDVTLYDPVVPSAAQGVMEWVRLSHESVTGRDGYSDFYKKDVTFNMLGPVGDVVEEWQLKGTYISEANRDLFLKLPLLIVPVVLSSVILSESQKKRLYSFWIVATVMAACFLIGQAYINYADTGHVRFWFYSGLAGGKHPAYFSMYCITAIIFLFLGKFEKWKALPLMLLLLMVFLLSSRMQILVSLAIAFVKVCLEFARNKKARTIVFIAFVGLISLFLSENVRSKIRLNTAQKEVGQLFSQDFKSTKRGAIWDFGLQIIQESPWIGYGNGDEFEVLNQVIQSKVQLKESDVIALANQTIQDTSLMKRLYTTAERRGWDKSDLHFH